MFHQRLQQKLLQKLSPQQIQMIKLLEIPNMELEQRIKEELEENPTLDEGNGNDSEETPESVSPEDEKGFSIDEYSNTEDIPSYKLHINNVSQGEAKVEIPFSVGASFHEFLTAQLGMRSLSDAQKIIAQYIIGNIDEDGYLRRQVESIVDDLAFKQNIEASHEEVLKVIQIIQEFDPPGVCARSLQECLSIQLRYKESTPPVRLAEKILSRAFDEFAKKHYDKIMARFAIDEEELREAIAEILKLNPKPGGTHSDLPGKDNHNIIPDFILENRDGELILTMNMKNVPELRVSRTYSEMFQSYSANKDKLSQDQKDTLNFVKQKLDAAKWFIDAIKQRQNTLMNTMQAIVNYQKEYFQDGDETRLIPMILKDIADKTGLDISTISRVANSKYVQTQFGILPLKSLFSEGMQTDSGEEVSSREIKSILQECIDKENKRKPLTDDQLAVILNEKGYLIARRTVAKYREQLNIPVARLRKEL